MALNAISFLVITINAKEIMLFNRMKSFVIFRLVSANFARSYCTQKHFSISFRYFS